MAWGPDSRIWVANAVGVAGGMAISVTSSGDLGLTWSKPYVERRTPAWVGCFPAIAVDDDPASADFGTVYVAYNWPESSKGPGLAVIASNDGRTWAMAKVPAVPGSHAYPDYDRIGYNVVPIRATAGGISAWVSSYQADLASWNPANVLDEGTAANANRRILAVTDLDFAHRPGAQPTLGFGTTGYAIATSSIHLDRFQTSLALATTGAAPTWWTASSARGIVVLSHPAAGGKVIQQKLSVTGMTSAKPSIAAAGSLVFVGWHAKDTSGRVWTFYSLSRDGGATFSRPAQLVRSNWHEPEVINGVGLRESADIEDGTIYYTYGDNRSGLGIYVARIQP